MTPGERKRTFVGLAFVSPWLLGFLIFTCYPVCASLYYSFCDYDVLSRPDPLFQTLRETLLEGVCTAVRAVNDYTPEQFEAFTTEARGWLTLVQPDGQITATSYPMTSWLGMYCIAAPEPSPTRYDSGVLRLYESRLGTMFSDATNSLLKSPFRTGHHAWTPLPGVLAVFPASALHEVATLRSATPLMLATVRVRFTAPGQLGHSLW